MWSWRTSASGWLLRIGQGLALLLVTWASAAAEPVEVPLRMHLLQVLVNQVPGGHWPILERDDQLFAPPEAFEAWRLQRPTTGAVDHQGLAYYPLALLPGAAARIEPTAGTLALSVSPDAFGGIQLRRESAILPRPDPVVPSVFLNYDLNLHKAYGRGVASPHSFGMLGELGGSGGWGLAITSFAARHVPGTGYRLARLETTLRRDFLAQGITLKLGDASTRAGYLGRQSLFGGVQLSTNFGLAPDLNRQPLPLVMGQTQAPSTVQLFVNSVLRQTEQIPAGPFTIDMVPAVSGRGNVSVVVRDLLGRETLVTERFFISADLLAPDLDDWSLELGRYRLEPGVRSFHYGDTFASGMWRRGLSSTFTGEARADLSRSRSVLGMAGVWSVAGALLARGGWMRSHDATLGAGQRWTTGLEWQNRSNTVILTAEGSSRAFRHPAEPTAALPVRLQLALHAATPLGSSGHLGAALVLQAPYDTPRTLTTSLSYTALLWERWHLHLSLARISGPLRGSAASLVLSVPLERRIRSTASVQWRDGHFDSFIAADGSPEGAYGNAWRLLAGYSDRPRAEGSLHHFGRVGIASAEVSATSRQLNLRLGANGGLLLTADRLFAIPRHDASAALVHVPGYDGVDVGLGSQIAARTDSGGYALVPRLRAFQANPIRLDANDLPLTAEIDSIEQSVVPPWRSVVLAQFPVRGGRGAMIRIMLQDGQPAPLGAVVRAGSDAREFYVGSNGDAYVTGLGDSNRLTLTWSGRSCVLPVQLPPGDEDVIARIGPVVCEGVLR